MKWDIQKIDLGFDICILTFAYSREKMVYENLILFNFFG